MSNEEAQKILDSMHGINPENLQGEAKKLFEAIMKIADERDSLRKTVERQNLEIMAQKDAHDFDAEITNDVNEIAVKLYKELEERDQIINAMAKYIVSLDTDEDICKHIKCNEGDKEREKCVKCIIEYFKNKMRHYCDTTATEK